MSTEEIQPQASYNYKNQNHANKGKTRWKLCQHKEYTLETMSA